MTTSTPDVRARVADADARYQEHANICELLDALERARERNGHAMSALMVTDILERGTKLLVAGEAAPVRRAFDADGEDGVVDLPGVMSREQQFAPVVLSAF